MALQSDFAKYAIPIMGTGKHMGNDTVAFMVCRPALETSQTKYDLHAQLQWCGAS